MKNKNEYKFKFGKGVFRSFKSNTSGGAYDQAVHYQSKHFPHVQGKPVLMSKNEKP